MISEIKKHLEIVAKFNSSNEKEIESFRINYIGRKGVLTNFFNEFKNVPKTSKKEYGSLLNNLKKDVLNKSTWYSLFVMIPLALVLSYYFKGLGLAIALLISEFISFIIHTILLSKSKLNGK